MEFDKDDRIVWIFWISLIIAIIGFINIEKSIIYNILALVGAMGIIIMIIIYNITIAKEQNINNANDKINTKVIQHNNEKEKMQKKINDFNIKSNNLKQFLNANFKKQIRKFSLSNIDYLDEVITDEEKLYENEMYTSKIVEEFIGIPINSINISSFEDLNNDYWRRYFTAKQLQRDIKTLCPNTEYFRNLKMLIKYLKDELKDNSNKYYYMIPCNVLAIQYAMEQKGINFQEKYKRELKQIKSKDNRAIIKEILNIIPEFDENNSNVKFEILYYMINQDFYGEEMDLKEIKKQFYNSYDAIIKNREYEKFKNKLNNDNFEEKIVTIDDIDLMNGTEFENLIGKLFNKMGYASEITKHSGDQGIDVIAIKNDIRIGIQAKCYSGSVGNSAVQEAVAGKKYYKVDRVIVVTNNYFTNSAIELAKVNDVVLWDRNILKEKINENSIEV